MMPTDALIIIEDEEVDSPRQDTRMNCCSLLVLSLTS
jgi:hypothetical protein